MLFAAELHNRRQLQILAVMTSTSYDYAPGCVDALMTHMGLTIPIATWKGGTLSDTITPGYDFTKHVYDNFSHPNGNLAATWPNMLTLYTSILTAAASASVTIIVTGWMTSMSALLAAQPTLCATKVKRLVLVAGNNDGSAEPNMIGDKVASHDVAANWPTEIVQVPCTIGTAMTGVGGNLVSGCPGKDALDSYGGAGPRNPWSLPGFDYIAGSSLYNTTAGTLAVNVSTGVDTFTDGAGPHKRLSLVNASNTYPTRYDNIFGAHAV